MLACVDALPQGTLVFFWRVVKLLAVNANVNDSLTLPSCVRNHQQPKARPEVGSVHTAGQITRGSGQTLNLVGDILNVDDFFIEIDHLNPQQDLKMFGHRRLSSGSERFEKLAHLVIAK